MNNDKSTRSVVATPLFDYRSEQTPLGVFLARVRLLKQRTAPWLQRIPALSLSKQRPRFSGFTLAELVVSMGVLVLLVLLFTQLLNSAATVTTLGHKQMDADSQAREVLDRMAIDLAQMVKRSDVDYYLKASGAASDCGACGTQLGNDQAAFYSTVAGYYQTVPAPPPGYTDKGPVSLLSYRINSNNTSASYNRMQRMGRGLTWNGFSPNWTPVVFLPQTIGGPQPSGGNWPPATSTTLDDSSYEIIGPQVFRFEYYYLLKTGSFSTTPWDTTAGHTNVSGMRDVSAIVADIAVIEPKSRQLIDNRAQVPPPNDNITLLSGTLANYSGQAPGVLLATWRSTLDANTIGLSRPAISGIRVYERYFYLNP
jgi:hypothetical protein